MTDRTAAARRRVRRAEQHIRWLRSEEPLGHFHGDIGAAQAERDAARAELATIERGDQEGQDG